MKVFQLRRFTDSLYFFFPAGRLFMKKQVQICCKNHVVMMEMFSNNIYRHFPPGASRRGCACFLCAHAHRRPLPFCTGKHKTNPPSA